MSDARIAGLPDRGVVSVAGEDAVKLLQGIITNDIEHVPIGAAVFAGLLSPQGKILFEFIAIRQSEGLLLDVDAAKTGDLVKRLTLYRLRAKVAIGDVSAEHEVAASWTAEVPAPAAAIRFTDPRNADLGERWIVPRGTEGIERSADSTAAYHAHRIGLGIPEGGKDYDFGDAFPHEANFDLDHGVSFGKGCYVGQEIVARMQHRGTVRKRVVIVSGTVSLAGDRPDVKMGDVVIGRLGSVAGAKGLALIRLDRAIEAIDAGTRITAKDIALEIDPRMIARQRALLAAKEASGP